MSALVLDSEGVSRLARRGPGTAVGIAHAALAAALRSNCPVLIPAAVLAEQYRGGRYDQPIDAFLARHGQAITIVDTDRALARAVGNLLARHQLGTAHHVDATVVAVAARAGGGVILTADPDDIVPLAAGVSGSSVVTV